MSKPEELDLEEYYDGTSKKHVKKIDDYLTQMRKGGEK